MIKNIHLYSYGIWRWKFYPHFGHSIIVFNYILQLTERACSNSSAALITILKFKPLHWPLVLGIYRHKNELP